MIASAITLCHKTDPLLAFTNMSSFGGRLDLVQPMSWTSGRDIAHYIRGSGTGISQQSQEAGDTDAHGLSNRQGSEEGDKESAYSRISY